MHAGTHLSQHHLLKTLFFPPFKCINTLCVKSIDCTYFWTLDSIPLFYMSALMPATHCLDYSSIVVSFEGWKCESTNLVLSFQVCFGYSGLKFHIHFRISLSISTKSGVTHSSVLTMLNLSPYLLCSPSLLMIPHLVSHPCSKLWGSF